MNKNSKIKSPKDLKGRKIGSPEWAHTAAVYMRGWLADEHGVSLKDVHWFQAGTNEPGRTEKVELNIPEGVKLTRVEDDSLSNLLAKGDIDCALVARPPDCFVKGHPDVARLFPNYLEMEEQYYERTKIWPIMHVIAVKRAILDQHPWIAGSLYNAFNESKNRALARMFEQSRCRAIPCPGSRLMRGGCVTCSMAIPFRSGSRKIGGHSSSSCVTRTSRELPTATPRWTTSFLKE